MISASTGALPLFSKQILYKAMQSAKGDQVIESAQTDRNLSKKQDHITPIK